MRKGRACSFARVTVVEVDHAAGRGEGYQRTRVEGHVTPEPTP
ncbi:hypothetical protein [Streptomyces sp. NPDC057877]